MRIAMGRFVLLAVLYLTALAFALASNFWSAAGPIGLIILIFWAILVYRMPTKDSQ